MNSSLIIRRSFDAVAAIQNACCLDAVIETIGHEFQRLGFSIIVGAQVSKRTSGQQVELLFGKIDHPWVSHYEARGWGQNCPIASSAQTRPLTWTEIKRLALAEDQRLIFSELNEFSLTDGHVVSIDRYDGFKTIVSLAGSNIDLTDPCVRTATHLMSIYFGLVGFELWEKHRPCAGELTARQKDCLRWVREGKTAWEIGSILGVSARTVEEHLALACRRLGVRTRIQAVAEAALRGLIEL